MKESICHPSCMPMQLILIFSLINISFSGAPNINILSFFKEILAENALSTAPWSMDSKQGKLLAMIIEMNPKGIERIKPMTSPTHHWGRDLMSSSWPLELTLGFVTYFLLFLIKSYKFHFIKINNHTKCIYYCTDNIMQKRVLLMQPPWVNFAHVLLNKHSEHACTFTCSWLCFLKWLVSSMCMQSCMTSCHS